MPEEIKPQPNTNEPLPEQKSTDPVSDIKKDTPVPAPASSAQPKPASNNTVPPSAPTDQAQKAEQESPQESAPKPASYSDVVIEPEPNMKPEPVQSSNSAIKPKSTPKPAQETELKKAVGGDAKTDGMEISEKTPPQKQEIENESTVPTTEPSSEIKPLAKKENEPPKTEIPASKTPVPCANAQAEAIDNNTKIEPEKIGESAPVSEVKKESASAPDVGNKSASNLKIELEKIEKAAPVSEIKKESAPESEVKPKEPSVTEVMEDKSIKPRKIDKEASLALKLRFKMLDQLDKANSKRRKIAENHKEKIIAFALKHNRIDNRDVRELTGLSDCRAKYYLNYLEKQRKLIQVGNSGPKVFYMPTR